MKKAILLKANPVGSFDTIYLNDEELRQLQQAVGGYIEAVSPDAITTLWCNEEGKLGPNPLPHNTIATKLWWVLDPHAAGGDDLHGDVVVTGGVDEDGNTQSISDETVALIERLLP